jgi:hypothetical protein
MADEPRPDPTPTAGTIQVDETDASTVYTNFAQVNVTPEEIVCSFGLNTQMQITKPIKTSHRVVMNFYTAKRLFNLLGQVIAQHEAAFGPLELDAQRRVRVVARPSTPPATLKPGPA